MSDKTIGCALQRRVDRRWGGKQASCLQCEDCDTGPSHRGVGKVTSLPVNWGKSTKTPNAEEGREVRSKGTCVKRKIGADHLGEPCAWW